MKWSQQRTPTRYESNQSRTRALDTGEQTVERDQGHAGEFNASLIKQFTRGTVRNPRRFGANPVRPEDPWADWTHAVYFDEDSCIRYEVRFSVVKNNSFYVRWGGGRGGVTLWKAISSKDEGDFGGFVSDYDMKVVVVVVVRGGGDVWFFFLRGSDKALCQLLQMLIIQGPR